MSGWWELICITQPNMKYSISYGSHIVVHLFNLLVWQGPILGKAWKERRERILHRYAWTFIWWKKKKGAQQALSYMPYTVIGWIFSCPIIFLLGTREITILQTTHNRVANNYSYIECFYTNFPRTHNLNKKLSFFFAPLWWEQFVWLIPNQIKHFCGHKEECGAKEGFLP